MDTHKKYVELLTAIIENVDDIRNTVECLLKATPRQTILVPKPNQALATHAQNFIYYGLEELGKFYLILSQYNKHLEGLDFKTLGIGDHNHKIQYLIDFIIKVQTENGKQPEWANQTKEVIKSIRSFKENNIYVNYKSGKIIKPLPNHGNGILEARVNLLVNGISLAKIILQDFQIKPSSYIHPTN